jgi:hypothetical protein
MERTAFLAPLIGEPWAWQIACPVQGELFGRELPRLRSFLCRPLWRNREAIDDFSGAIECLQRSSTNQTMVCARLAFL